MERWGLRGDCIADLVLLARTESIEDRCGHLGDTKLLLLSSAHREWLSSHRDVLLCSGFQWSFAGEGEELIAASAGTSIGSSSKFKLIWQEATLLLAVDTCAERLGLLEQDSEFLETKGCSLCERGLSTTIRSVSRYPRCSRCWWK